MQFELVKTRDKLIDAYREWKESPSLGVDIECENNLHHYGAFITLIQISNQNSNWLVDVLELKDISPVIEVLENQDIQKIFHDVSFDFRILNHDVDCHPKNVFDTQIAAMMLGKENLGLGSLLDEYFGVNKKEKLQMADWTKRPLPDKMLEYACKDTSYLIKLRDNLIKELKEKNRLSWAKQEFEALEEQDFELTQQEFYDLKGLRRMNPQQRAVLRRLYNLRDKMARKVNRPVHYIMSTRKMQNFAKKPPKSIQEWQKQKGVHPIVKQKAKRFYDAVAKGQKETVDLPTNNRKRYTAKQKHHMGKLTEFRNQMSEKLNIKKHVLLSKDQMKDIVLTNSYSSLREWQKELFEKYY